MLGVLSSFGLAFNIKTSVRGGRGVRGGGRVGGPPLVVLVMVCHHLSITDSFSTCTNPKYDLLPFGCLST